MLPHVRTCHARIHARFSRAEPFPLDLARRDNALAHACARLARLALTQLLEWHRRRFDVQVDAIQQRARDLFAVTLHLHLRATAVAFYIPVIPAWAWIHGRHKHE